VQEVSLAEVQDIVRLSEMLTTRRAGREAHCARGA
jgi:hypothetical protein